MTTKAAQPTAGAALGQLMKLVEDGILVRNTKDDGDFSDYAFQSIRLVSALKDAQLALESLAETHAGELLGALERLEHNFNLLLLRKPVRDCYETLAEVRAAIDHAKGKP